jgi:filamentous hemagglutinin family protein
VSILRYGAAIPLLLALLAPGASKAEPNIVEVPASITPATVGQWSKYSFSIDVRNASDQDILLDPNTNLRFGMGTGHPCTQEEWGATDQDECCVNLTEQVLIPSASTVTLNFHKGLVCGYMPEGTYHPQLVFRGTSLGSVTPVSETLNTEANPITVTYQQLQQIGAGAISSFGKGPYLVYRNGGRLRSPAPPHDHIATWTLQVVRNVPTEMRCWLDPNDPAFDIDVKFRPQENTTVIPDEPAQSRAWTVSIDDYETVKQCSLEFAVYPRVDTEFNCLYLHKVTLESPKVLCPHQSGSRIITQTSVGADVVFDDAVDLDLVQVDCPDEAVGYGQVLDVNVAVQNNKTYPILIDLSADRTYLTFRSGGTDVSSHFRVTYPAATQVGAAAARTLAFHVAPACGAPAGQVTVDPTLGYYNDFADAEDLITLTGQKTGSAYPEPVTGTFSVEYVGPCEDSDADGLYDFEDNCPHTYNPLQTDSDADGPGNACDNCPYDFNPDQNDTDSDGFGSACDNCPNLSNPDQADGDAFHTEPVEGVVSYWRFDELAGTVAADSVNGNNALVRGATWTDAGRVRGALSFDGGNNNVLVFNPSGLDFGTYNQMTVEAWFKLTGHHDYDGIVTVNRQPGQCCAYRLMVTSDMHPFYDPGEPAYTTVSDFTFELGRWYHYVMAVQGAADAVIYVNGQQIHRSPLAVPADLPYGHEILIGTGERQGAHATQGIIDEAAVYRRALTADEVRTHYQAGLKGLGLGYACLGDGLGDLCDNCPERLNPSQQDSDADEVGDACECEGANVNGIDPVDFIDLTLLAANWLLTGNALEGDINADEKVDFSDISTVASYWLSNCPP